MQSEKKTRIDRGVEAGVSSVHWEERQAIGPEAHLRMIVYVLCPSITRYRYPEYPTPSRHAPC